MASKLNQREERLKKLELLLIPDCAAAFISEQDIAIQAHLSVKLWEYHLEAKEIRAKVKEAYRIMNYSLIRVYNDGCTI